MSDGRCSEVGQCLENREPCAGARFHEHLEGLFADAGGRPFLREMQMAVGNFES